jgi:hypothetical protein
MDHALRNDAQLTWAEGHGITIFAVQRNFAFKDQKEIIRTFVFVERKFTRELYDHNVIAVIGCDDVRVPMGAEHRQLFREIDLLEGHLPVLRYHYAFRLAAHPMTDLAFFDASRVANMLGVAAKF